jgi:hypothetical protein
LAGQKRGFLGSGRSRRRAGARHFFVHVSRDRKRQDGRFSSIMNWKINFGRGMLRMHHDELYNGNVIDIRSLPKGRSPVFIHSNSLFYINIYLVYMSRAAWMDKIQPHLPSHSLDRWVPTRETCLMRDRYQGDLAMPHLWQSWPNAQNSPNHVILAPRT